MWECPTCGHEHLDQADTDAEERGGLTYAEAARRCRRSPQWVKDKIKAGKLRTTEFADRIYVSERSLNALLRHRSELHYLACRGIIRAAIEAASPDCIEVG
jgi:hypothetical protein